jgi:hypothetical protein
MPRSSVACNLAIMLKRRTAALLILLLIAALAPRTRAFQATSPCADDPNFHAFDFWIGEWDVQPTGAARAPIGSGATSIVESQLGGCVIQENWLPGGRGAAGKSFNVFNAVTKQWEQYYVDAGGRITYYRGAFTADGTLQLEADQFGTTNRVRMTFFRQGPTQVRQLGQLSSDGGATWRVTFDLTYIRKT